MAIVAASGHTPSRATGDVVGGPVRPAALIEIKGIAAFE
jgi:hypothetical protein